MSARKAAVTVWVCTAYDAAGSYDVSGVGATEEEALRLCKAAVKRARKQAGRDPWPAEYFDDLSAMPLTTGTAVYDMGAAGEVR